MLVSFLQFLFQALRTPSKKCHFVEVMQNILNQDELNFLLRGQKPAAEGGRSAQPGPETEAPSPAEETLRSADTPSPSGAGGRSWQEIFSDAWGYSITVCLGIPATVRPSGQRFCSGTEYAGKSPRGAFLALLALPPFPKSVFLTLSARLCGAFLDAGLGGNSPQDCERPLTELEQALILHILRSLPGCLACALAPASPAPAFLRHGTDAGRLWPELSGRTLSVSSFEVFLEGVSGSFEVAFLSGPGDEKSPGPHGNGAV